MSIETDRKKEVVNIWLDLFIEKGLTATSTRDLSSALKMQNAALYYYFESKEDAVIACAEEAAIRLENALIPPALKEIHNPDMMMERLQSRAEDMSPTMRFLVTVCADSQYKDKMKPALCRLVQRYDYYAGQVAEELNCEKSEILPYVYMIVTSVVNYMIFGDESFLVPQMGLFKEEIKQLFIKKIDPKQS